MLVSVIAPCFNEAQGLGEFLAAVRDIIASLPQFRFEILFVDDGSTDETEHLLAIQARVDPQVRVLVLSRNFGHQRAIMAGLEWSRGDYVVILDADLQDPPELIPELLAALDAGHDIVHAVRSDRRVDTFAKRVSARIFYYVMRRSVLPDIVENSGDFKAFTRAVASAILDYPERILFMRGLFSVVGFRQTRVPFVRAARHAGSSKYPLKKVLRLARDAILANSMLPLRLVLLTGVLSIPVSMTYLLWTAASLSSGSAETGTVHLALAFVAALLSVLLCAAGITGEYLRLILIELQRRPRYNVRATYNLEARSSNAATR